MNIYVCFYEEGEYSDKDWGILAAYQFEHDAKNYCDKLNFLEKWKTETRRNINKFVEKWMIDNPDPPRRPWTPLSRNEEKQGWLDRKREFELELWNKEFLLLSEEDQKFLKEKNDDNYQSYSYSQPFAQYQEIELK